MSQKILVLGTRKPMLRGPIEMQNAEDGDLFEYNERLGCEVSEKPKVPTYRTVMEALHDGWKLLLPPSKTDSYYLHDGSNVGLWGWWLVRDDFVHTGSTTPVVSKTNEAGSMARGIA